MSNILNLKGVKLFAIVVLAAAVLATFGMVAVQKASADCSINSTLRLGSTGAEVVCLQTALGGLTADGSFGPMTRAAVMSFQSNSGLVADGVFGPMSRAVWLANNSGAGGNFPAGCTSASGYSTTTGMACSGASNLPAGCTSTSGYSTTTGMSCSVTSNLPAGCSSTSGYSPTTGAKCDGTGSTPSPSPSSGSDEGELKNFDSVSAEENGFSEDESGVELYAFEMEADGSDMMVSRLDVYMGQTEAAESDDAQDYFDSATLLVDGEEVATLDVEDWDQDDWDQTADTDNDEFRLRFDGNFTVKDGDTATVTVEFDTANNIDTADSDNATWQIDLANDSVRAEDEAGFSDEYGETANEKTVTVDEVDTATLDVSVGSDNPTAQSLEADDTDDTNGVAVLAFDAEANDGDVAVDELTVTVTIVGAATEVNDIVNTLHLLRGGEEIASESVPADGGDNAVDVTFDIDEDSADEGLIEDGDTAEFTVEADINNLDGAEFDATDGISVAFTNVNAEDDAGDNVDAGGSAAGNNQIFYTTGVSVDMGTVTYESVTDGPDTTQVTYNIPLTVTSFGDTRYVGLSAEEEDDVTVTDDIALSYAMQVSSAPTADIVEANTTTIDTWSCDATIVGGIGYRLDEGDAVHCTLQVILTATTTTPGSYRVHVEGFQTYLDAALTNDATNELIQTLTPSEDYQTAFKLLSS